MFPSCAWNTAARMSDDVGGADERRVSDDVAGADVRDRVLRRATQGEGR